MFGVRSGLTFWDGLEIVARVRLEPFGVVDEAREDDDAEQEEADEQEQLFGAGTEGVDKDFEAARVASELEETQNADDVQEIEHVGLVAGRCQMLVRDNEVVDEADGGNEVYHINAIARELTPVGRNQKSDEDLEEEPDVAKAFDVEEGRVGFCLAFVEPPSLLEAPTGERLAGGRG